MQKIIEYLENNKKTHLNQLIELLKIPSISSQSGYESDLIKTANWIKNHFAEIGLENSAVLETDGHPLIYADWLHAEDKPTVLIYGHYDVQAPDPVDDWVSPPFEPKIRDGNIYGRGTSDNKGQFFTHLKGVEAVLKVLGKLPVNVKFLIEGEEEVGGPSLDKFIEQNKELLKADVCVISDTHSLALDQPLIIYGLKGIVYAEVSLEVMPKDMHSGTYGGNIPNAAIELANLIAKLKDNDSQEVLIEGFYDNVREITEKEKTEFENQENTILEESGAKQLLGIDKFSPAERAGAQPTLDVNGMHSGYTAEGAKTIIPAKASAKVSMRLVPHQTPEEIEEKFRQYVKKVLPGYVDYEIKVFSTGSPIIVNRDSPYMKTAEKALEETFGNPPKFQMEGGSIPVTATLFNLLGIDSILMGFGLPDDGLHSPNEKLSLEMFYKGIECSARLLTSF